MSDVTRTKGITARVYRCCENDDTASWTIGVGVTLKIEENDKGRNGTMEQGLPLYRFTLALFSISAIEATAERALSLQMKLDITFTYDTSRRG